MELQALMDTQSAAFVQHHLLMNAKVPSSHLEIFFFRLANGQIERVEDPSSNTPAACPF